MRKQNIWITEIIGINYFRYCNDVVDINIRYKDVNDKEKLVQLTLTRRDLGKLKNKINKIGEI